MKKVFIITGANRGLGKAFVDVLINSDEYFIISISRSRSEEQKKYSLKNFYFLEADLSQNELDQKILILKEIISNEDICFINNASVIDPIKRVGEFEKSEIDTMISVNIKSSILITNYLLKEFNNNKLSFVNISSGAANRAISNWSLYCSSKAFVKMFFEVAESENKEHFFLNIDPGVMDTNMQDTIRRCDFPNVMDFKNFKEKGKLKIPNDVAIEILNKLP